MSSTDHVYKIATASVTVVVDSKVEAVLYHISGNKQSALETGAVAGCAVLFQVHLLYLLAVRVYKIFSVLFLDHYFYSVGP